jgi:glycosyltransferase involved in cell wall biosynthesis
MKQVAENMALGKEPVADARGETPEIVLIGPCTPAEGGTTIPFRLLAEYVGSRHGSTIVYDTHPHGRIFNEQPASVLSAVWNLFAQCAAVLKATRRASACLVNGSPRYLCTAGAAMVALLSFCGRKRISVYAAGGAFDQYLFRIPFPFRQIIVACLRRADVVILQTRSSAAVLAKMFDSIHVIPNWVESPKVEPRIEQSVANRPFRFIFAGEVREGKGVWQLLQAFPRVSEQLAGDGISSSLEIVGPCKDLALLSLLQDLCAGRTDIIWHGPCSHGRTLELISDSDCLVLPTFHAGEGYPGVILEALVRAKPVITCALRPLVELFSRARASLLVPPRDVGALAEAMISIASNDGLRTRLATANLELGEEFSTRRVLPEFCTIAQI